MKKPSSDSPHDIHDRGYKLLFSFCKLFQQLLEGYVDADWTRLLDFSQSQQVNKTFILPDFQKQESDILYKVPLKNAHQNSVYLYVLIEHQSSVDFSLAFRIFLYLSDLWRELYQNTEEALRTQKSFRLSPVFPIVLYNGQPPWTASTSLNQLVEQSHLFNDFLPQLKYYLVDIPRLSEEKLKQLHNSLAAVFLLERDMPGEQYEEVLKMALEFIVKDADSELAKSLYQWILRRFQEKTEESVLQKVIQEISPQTEQIQELKTMLELMPQKLIDFGKQEGEQNGIRKSLLKTLTKKFHTLPEKLEKKLEQIKDENLLLKLIEDALDVDSLKEFEKKISTPKKVK